MSASAIETHRGTLEGLESFKAHASDPQFIAAKRAEAEAKQAGVAHVAGRSLHHQTLG